MATDEGKNASPEGGSRFEFLMPDAGAPAGAQSGFVSWGAVVDEREELRRAVVAAYEKGYRKGHEEAAVWKARAQGRALEALGRALEARETMLAELEGELVKLAVAIAEKVIKETVRTDAVRCLERQITACLRQLDRDVPVQIRLNPDDIQEIRETIAADGERFPLLERVRFVEDRRIGRGGCVLETEKGALRATLGEQLEKLARVLEREYGNAVTEQMGSTPLGGE